MPLSNERRQTVRTHRGWAINVLQEAGAVLECETHGWMRDRTDPHARDHALDMARSDPPAGLSSEEAETEVQDVLASIGDSCPDCETSGT